MTGLRSRLLRWRDDPLLRRVVKNSSYLSSGNALAAGLSLVQGILAARLLGVKGLGEVTTIISIVTAVNVLLSFRMSEVVVKHVHQVLADDRQDEAAAIVKGAALTEGLTSVAAYLVLLILSGWAAQVFIKDPAAQSLIIFYGIIILSNLIFETSRGVLQTYGQFGRFALINLSQTILTFAIILVAYLSATPSIPLVLGAYIAGKTLAGIAIVVLALRVLNQYLPGWRKAPLQVYKGWKGLLSFALNTNLNGTVNLFVRDNVPLYIAALASTTEVGYFKVAFGFTNLLMLPIEPFIWPTYTEITRSISNWQLSATRRLLRRVSGLSAAWVLAAGSGIVLLGWWIIPLLYGAQYAPAYPAAVILIAGYGFANIFGWSRALLLALGMPSYPLIVSAVVGAAEVALIFLLVPIWGYLAASAILSGYLILANGIIVWRGVRELRHRTAISIGITGSEA